MHPNFEIRLLGEADVDLYEDHVERASKESGDGNTPIFMVLQGGSFQRKPAEIRKLWEAGLHEERWRRTWGAWTSGKIIGNVMVQGTGSPNAKHRAIIALGIESPFRRMRLGHALIETAADWAKKQEFIEWLDFSIFQNNFPSLEFCKKFSFQETGFQKDALRIMGHKIDLIKMTHKLR